MPKTKLILTLSVLILVALACNFAAPTEQPNPPVTVIVEPTSSVQQPGVPRTEDEVPRVSLEEARAAMESGTAVIVDVRSPSAYEASHIAGAISIPLGEIETNPNGLDLEKDQWIITYCT